MADPAAKKILQDLARDESLKNRSCADCGNPNPQWASISFANFICLQCAGAHRGFGVHISFVRSISMDSWQDDQLRRMKLGGNAPLIDFLRAYPTEGGYKDGMSIHDKYHSWAATQYREKLTAILDGKEWSPSPPPPPSEDAPSTQGLRKSRTSARSSPVPSILRQNSSSPAPISSSAEERKAANEGFFASLGAANASRPDDIPPSQGGRYTGFGSTPEPGPPEHLTSAAAPTLQELQTDPMRALSKSWTLFAGAVAGASRAVSENVIQPGMERVADPELRAKVGGYVTTASQRATIAAETANAWGKERFGVDVGERVGSVVEAVRGGPPAKGYAAVDQWGGAEDESSALYTDAAEDDFFKDNLKGGFKDADEGEWQDMPTSTSTSIVTSSRKEPEKKSEDWDEWKDF